MVWVVVGVGEWSFMVSIDVPTHARTLESLETGGLAGKVTCVARSMVFSCSTFSWLCPSPKGRQPKSICPQVVGGVR